MAGPY